MNVLDTFLWFQIQVMFFTGTFTMKLYLLKVDMLDCMAMDDPLPIRQLWEDRV
jgi:hypothetical protein